MSYRLTEWAWSVADLAPSTRLVLLALADCCNGNRRTATCWPSLSHLEDKTGLSRASLKRALRDLEARDLIDRRPGDGRRATVYRLACQDSPNKRLDLGDPNTQVAPPGSAGTATGRSAGDPAPAAGRGVIMNPLNGSRGVTVTPLGGHDEPPGGSHRPPEPGIEPGKGTGGTERDLPPRARAHAREAAADPALSGPPAPRWREVAATVRPDITDPGAVRRKFEAYHRGRTFPDEAAEERAWELWLLRECTTRAKRYTDSAESAGRAAGSFLRRIVLHAEDLTADDLTADYEVIQRHGAER